MLISPAPRLYLLPINIYLDTFNFHKLFFTPVTNMLLQQSKVLAGRRSSLAAWPHHHHQRVWAHRVYSQSRIVTDRTAPTYGRQAKIACRSSSHPATGGPADSSSGGFNDGSMDLEAFLAELRARRGRQGVWCVVCAPLHCVGALALLPGKLASINTSLPMNACLMRVCITSTCARGETVP
jgi:hypothetical protein